MARLSSAPPRPPAASPLAALLAELAHDRNDWRFDQLCEQIALGNVVPFIGAGLSQPGGFPTWKEHLRQQGRTAGLPPEEVEAMLAVGDYEGIVHAIEDRLGQLRRAASFKLQGQHAADGK